MKTSFELVLEGEDPSYLRSAGEEALEEVERVEEQLSFFLLSSEVSWINRMGYPGPLKVEPRLLSLISRSLQICRETGGAFDITATPLLSCWGITERRPRSPKEWEIRRALELIGPDKIEVDLRERSLRFKRDGVSISLGGIGKGYAVWRAAKILEEKRIESAVISGGGSTIYALKGKGWRIGIVDPVEPKRRVAVIRIDGMAISTSSTVDGDGNPHIVDPRTGMICEGVRSVSVVCEDPVMADALSTAFLVMDRDEVASFCRSHEGVAAIFPSPSGRVERIGMDLDLEEV
jgi:thiamine biosynthesis lipoprotein